MPKTIPIWQKQEDRTTWVTTVSINRFFLLFLLCFSTLSSVEEEKTLPPTPNPLQLSLDWWQSFFQNKETFNKRTQELEHSLEEKIAILSPPLQAQAKEEVKKISLSFQSLLQILAQAPLPPLEPTTIAPEYTISALIQLNRDARQIDAALRAEEEDREIQKEEIEARRRQLGALFTRYQKTQERSEQRLILGLQLVHTQVAKVVAEQKILQLDQLLKRNKEKRVFLKEEMETALGRLTIDRTGLRRLQAEIYSSEANWKQAKTERQKKEVEPVSLIPELGEEYSEVRSRYRNLNLMQTDIAEALAYANYLSAQITHDLAKLLYAPEEVDPFTQEETILERREVFTVLKQRVSGWTKQAQKQIERDSLLLSLKEELAPDSQEEVVNWLQKSILLAQENVLQLKRISNEIDNTLLILEQLEKRVIKKLGTGKKWLLQVTHFLSEIYQTSKNLFSRELLTMGGTSITVLSLFRFLFVLLIAILLSKILVKGLDRLAYKRRKVEKSLIYKIKRLIHYSILAIGFIIALTAVGFDFSSFLLIAGALGVGLGFGLQTTFNNFFSGIVILFETHLKVGDFIELEAGIRGEIREINFRNTLIRTNDGKDVLVPNSEIINNRIINWTHRDTYRRLHIPFYTSLDADKDNVAKLIAKAASKVSTTVTRGGLRPPVVFFIQYGESRMEFELAVWVDGRCARRTKGTTSGYLWAIDDALRKEGIAFPFPKQKIEIETDKS